jgi:hypothetical protein
MKKIILVLGVMAILGGCAKPLEIQYKGKIRSEETVEEMLEDRLESENPNLDIEVDVYEETDTKKVKVNSEKAKVNGKKVMINARRR